MNANLQQVVKNVYPLFDHTKYPDDLTGWDGDNPIFGRLIDKYRPEVVIEVGTWKGQSAINMAESAAKLGLATTVVCVDTWLGSSEHWDIFRPDLKRKFGYPTVYYQFLANVCYRNLQERIVPLPIGSTSGAELLAKWGVRADMVYIDANHMEEAVRLDMRHFKPLIRPGGLLFGHDWQFQSVRRAVQGFCARHQLSFEIEQAFWLIPV